LAETSIHAGASTSAGVIDLPIQREAHTGWPCVFGSGLKGAMRAAAEGAEEEWNWIAEVFGPGGNNASDHAGALAVGDARLLLLPVRSLTTHFKWVTCPALVQRAQADFERLGLPVEHDGLVPEVTEGGAVLVPMAGKAESGKPKKLFLEELSFDERPQDLSILVDFLARLMGGESAKERLQRQLAVVSDDIFTRLAQFATPVTAHIAIDNERKTVKNTALWYEETLPPETLLYATLTAWRSRKKESVKTDRQVLDHITSDLLGDRPYLQLGGNETVGMGWCKVITLAAATAPAAAGKGGA
jgi:CRISPR-associated protein Cmr4